MPRNIPTTVYSERTKIEGEVMAIIASGFWDDLEVWEDGKYWIDTGGTSFGTIYTLRPTITTNYT